MSSAITMLDTRAVTALACPVCGLRLAERSGALVCDRQHAFDIARQGYVNLLPGTAVTGTADTPAMLEARSAFLGRGHYAPIADAVGEAAATTLKDGPVGCVAEVGAGTGYYLAAVLDRLPEHAGLALDISKAAAKRAARAHARIAAVVCDVWRRLPVRDGAVALVLDVFAPRNPAEFSRVLAPGGALVIVTPTAEHLREIVGPLGLLGMEKHKGERLERALEGRFERVARSRVTRTLTLAHDDIRELAGMGPSAWHAAVDLDERVDVLPASVPVTLSVDVAVFRPAR